MPEWLREEYAKHHCGPARGTVSEFRQASGAAEVY
jgi:hypothetical protein